MQRQLYRLEAEGVLVSQMKGRTRLFQWNPRAELTALLEKALQLMPAEDRRCWHEQRRRPCRTGKPL